MAMPLARPFAATSRTIQGSFINRSPNLRGSVLQSKTPVQRRPGVEAFSVSLQPKSGGWTLPHEIQTKMEAAFGAGFSDVRIHVGADAGSIGAVAFTWGSDIHFAPGQYSPHTPHGQFLLGHELAHVVQQRAGRVTNPFGSGVAVVQDRALEAEADRFGRLAASGVSTQAHAGARPTPRSMPPQFAQGKFAPRPATAPWTRTPGAIQRYVIEQPGYASGDMFGIAATLVLDPTAKVLILGDATADKTIKPLPIRDFYYASLPLDQHHRVQVLQIESVRNKTEADKLLIKNKIAEMEGTAFKRALQKGVNWGTQYIGKGWSVEKRNAVRAAWGVDDSKDDAIKAWLEQERIPTSGGASRFSGRDSAVRRVTFTSSTIPGSRG